MAQEKRNQQLVWLAGGAAALGLGYWWMNKRPAGQRVKEDMKDAGRTMRASAANTADRVQDRARDLGAAADRATSEASHAVQATKARATMEQDKQIAKNPDVPMADRAKAAGDIALRKAEEAYHDAAQRVRESH